MNWGHIVGAFFAGVFLVNTIPHFVKGVCGDKHPTPFANPPVIGLSSAPVNMVWSLGNLLVGLVLWHISKVMDGESEFLAFVLGGVIVALSLSVHFQRKRPS